MKRIFEWDQQKEQTNRKKHGVSFHEAMTAFSDEYGLSKFDDSHSEAEDRWILLGLSETARLVVVVFTERESHEVTRIISARLATLHETQYYQSRRPS